MTLRSKSGKRITAARLDAKFDRGDDVMEYFDLDRSVLVRKVNVDFPEWMIAALDRHARRIGINRQALIKTWINECLERYKDTLPPSPERKRRQ